MEYLVPLWEHQKKAVELSKSQTSFALFMETGTGKTATLINILRTLFTKNKRIGKTLIFSPPITLSNWHREWGVHSKIQEQVCVLKGSGAKRLKDFLKGDKKIYITNYEALLMEPLFEAFLKWEPEVLVGDESHKTKDIKARRTKQFILLSDIAKHKYLLTGTPVLNTPMDIFSQFRALDGGETFGKNFFAFRATYFYDANASMPRDRYFPNWKIRPGAIEEINEKIYTKAYRVRKEECLDLPPLVKQVHEVELSPEQARAYEEMKQDFITTIRGETCVATLAITKALKLMQIVSGFVNAEKASVRMKWTPRQLALQELLETLCIEHKVLVWAVFKENYRQIAEVCDALKLKFVEVHGEVSEKDREVAVKNFQKDPETKVFIGHPGSGGIGINLVEASYSIWYSRNFSLEQDIQAEARNYRAGSEQHVKITRIDLVARGTIDEEITKRLANKQAISDRVLQEIASLI